MDRKTILNPADCDLKRLPLSALEAFVLSQFDGRMTLEDVAEIAGLDLALATGLAKRLVELGAVSTEPVKGSRKSRAPARPKTEAPPSMGRTVRSERPARHDPRAEKESLRPAQHEPRVSSRSLRPPRHDPRTEKHSLRPSLRVEGPSVGQSTSRKSLRMASVSGARAAVAAADETCDLDAATHASITLLEGKLKTHDHYALLQIDRGAEKKAVKLAYFALASRFHPDRFFGKKLGRARAPLERVFHRLTEAHDVLTDRTRREAYDATLTPAPESRSLSKAPKPRSLPPRQPSRKLNAVVAPTPAPKSPTVPPRRATTTPRPPPAARAIIPPPVRSTPVVEAAKKATVLDGSLRRIYAAAHLSETHKRVQLFVRAAEDAVKADDLIGAANNYRLALQNAEDPHIRAKLEEVQQLAAAKKKRK